MAMQVMGLADLCEKYGVETERVLEILEILEEKRNYSEYVKIYTAIYYLLQEKGLLDIHKKREMKRFVSPDLLKHIKKRLGYDDLDFKNNVKKIVANQFDNDHEREYFISEYEDIVEAYKNKLKIMSDYFACAFFAFNRVKYISANDFCKKVGITYPTLRSALLRIFNQRVSEMHLYDDDYIKVRIYNLLTSDEVRQKFLSNYKKLIDEVSKTRRLTYIQYVTCVYVALIDAGVNIRMIDFAERMGVSTVSLKNTMFVLFPERFKQKSEEADSAKIRDQIAVKLKDMIENIDAFLKEFDELVNKISSKYNMMFYDYFACVYILLKNKGYKLSIRSFMKIVEITNLTKTWLAIKRIENILRNSNE